jgi:metallo-beta-lactamase class B
MLYAAEDARILPFGTDGIETYPPARVDQVLHDGDTVVLGGVTLTPHRTGGHTRGCTTWTFRTHISSDPAGRFRNVVIVGGWRALSQYRLLDTPGQPAYYPGIKEDFYKTFATLRALPCDIFLGAHGTTSISFRRRTGCKPRERPRSSTPRDT